MKPMFIAEAIGRKPESSEFRILLSSSYRYGLTKGSYASEFIELTPLGTSIVKPVSPEKKVRDLQDSAQKPDIFRDVYEYYQDGKFPIADEFFKNKLEMEFGIPKEFVDECIQLLNDNGRFVGIIRDVAGAPRVVFESAPEPAISAETPTDSKPTEFPSSSTPSKQPEIAARPIFIAHGKDKTPVEQLKNILSRFNIPSLVAEEEASEDRSANQQVDWCLENADCAIILGTADDKDLKDGKLYPRRNVHIEIGRVQERLPGKVIYLLEEGASFPSDITEKIHERFTEENMEEAFLKVAKELKAFGIIRAVSIRS
jgi:hypothetical protein